MRLALDYAGDQLAVGRDDLTISLWVTQQSEPIRILRGTTGSFRLVAFSPDGQHLSAVSETDAVYVWDIETAQRRWRQAGPEAIFALRFTPAGDRLLCTSLGSGGTWFDAATGDAVARLSLGRQALTDGALDPAGRRLAAVVDERTVSVWRLVPAESMGLPITPEQPIQIVAVHPEGTWLALGEAGGDVVVVPIAVTP